MKKIDKKLIESVVRKALGEESAVPNYQEAAKSARMLQVGAHNLEKALTDPNGPLEEEVKPALRDIMSAVYSLKKIFSLP